MSTTNEHNLSSLLLHPITLEVYRVPTEAITEDFGNPIPLSSAAFKDMSSLGCMSAEKFLQAGDPAHPVGFTVQQVLAVRLKGHEAAVCDKPMYAWASRMTTTSVCTDWTGTDSMGAEFLWLWPPGKAWNAWITRKEQQRVNPAEEVAWGLDAYEPSVRYMPKYPGLMLGPDDIDGCARVPLEELTVAQRLFVSCIKPQQTLFARRSLAQDWTDRITRMTNESQENFHDDTLGPVRQLRSLVGPMMTNVTNSDAGTLPLARHCPLLQLHHHTVSPDQTAKEQRCHQEHMRCMQQPVNDGHKRARISRLSDHCKPVEKHRMAKEASLKLERALASPGPMDDAAIAREHCKIVQTVQTAWSTQYQRGYKRRWGSLPDEVLVNILCLRLNDDLEVSTTTAAATICNLRCVSKSVRAVTDRFVGAQLASLVVAFHSCVLLPSSGVPRSILSVGVHMRRLGLEPRSVMRLESTRAIENYKDETLELSAASLPLCPNRVPDWRAYLRERKAHEAWLGRRATVKTPRRPPSGDFADFYASVRASNPAVNGERFAAEASGRAHLPNPAFDSMLCADGGASGGVQDALACAGLA